MRFGPDDKFWVVTDATPESALEDIMFQTSLRGLDLQFKGGLTIASHPTLFTDEREASIEATGRLLAMRASLGPHRHERRCHLKFGSES